MYKKNAWKKYNGDYKAIFDFNEGYKSFITKGKTERLAVNETLKLAKEKGFKDINEFETLKKGDKVYVTNMNKNVALFVVGEKPLTDGLRRRDG